jgi:hypothetical protein
LMIERCFAAAYWNIWFPNPPIILTIIICKPYTLVVSTKYHIYALLTLWIIERVVLIGIAFETIRESEDSKNIKVADGYFIITFPLAFHNDRFSFVHSQ